MICLRMSCGDPYDAWGLQGRRSLVNEPETELDASKSQRQKGTETRGGEHVNQGVSLLPAQPHLVFQKN